LEDYSQNNPNEEMSSCSSLSQIDQIQESAHLLLLRHQDGAVGERQTAGRGHEPLLPGGGGGALLERVGEGVEPGVHLGDDVPLPVVGRHLNLEDSVPLLGRSSLPRGRENLTIILGLKYSKKGQQHFRRKVQKILNFFILISF